METKATQQEIIAGGTTVSVEFNDGVRDVFVRQVPMRHINDLGRAWSKEERELKVYAPALTDEDADKLTEEGWSKVIEEGRRLNFTRFEKWFARQQSALKAMGVDLQKEIEGAAKTASLNAANS